MREHGQKTDNLRITEKREIFGVPHILRKLLILWLAEKGGSRTLRGPYDPQTGFEDQRHHRAPSFSDSVFNYFRDAVLFCLPIRLSICDVPKVFATSAAWRSKYRWCICTLLEPLALLATSTEIPACRRATQPQHRACWQGLSDGLKRFAREAEHTRCPRGQLAAGAGYCSFLGGPALQKCMAPGTSLPRFTMHFEWISKLRNGPGIDCSVQFSPGAVLCFCVDDDFTLQSRGNLFR
jgi:hypothetical protein